MVLCILETEVEPGIIPEKDEIENEGECGTELNVEGLLWSRSRCELKSGAKVRNPLVELLVIVGTVFTT